MDVLVLSDQQELFYIRSMRTQDVVWKTYQDDRERLRESQRNPCGQRDLMMMMMMMMI